MTLHEVAAQAGVGIGTVYRHFHSKDELVDEVLITRVGEVAELLQDALRDPDAWRGMTRFLDAVVSMQLTDRGLRETLGQHRVGGDCAQACREHILPLLDALVEHAKEQGAVRSDLEASDLIFIQAALAAVVDERVRQFDPQLHRRYLAMLLDGVRASGTRHSELPVLALSLEQVHVIMACGATGSASS